MPPKLNPPSASAAPTLPTPRPSSSTSLAAAAVTAAIAAASLSSTNTAVNVKAKQPPTQRKPGAGGGGGGAGKAKSKSPATLSTMKTPSSSTAKISSASSLSFMQKKSGSTPSAASASAPSSSSSLTAATITSTFNSEKQLAQFKIERAQIAEKELAEMDAIERAFREDDTVWNGPTNVIFPRRYHASTEIGMDGNTNIIQGQGSKSKAASYTPPIISSSSPLASQSTTHQKMNNNYYYGSQSRGWMYSEGYAGIGGRSWMQATTATPSSSPSNLDKQQQPQQLQNSTTKKNSFLLNDVSIIDTSLRANGLSRHDITPTAYACLLEQARRYTYELLANAQDYAIHAKRNSIHSLLPADILLAAEMLADSNTDDCGSGIGSGSGSGSGAGDIHGVASTLPTPEQIMEFASTVNRVPLPPIPSHCYNGVALPPAEEQLTARTYDVVNGARVVQRMMRGGDLPLIGSDLGIGIGGGVRSGVIASRGGGGGGAVAGGGGSGGSKMKPSSSLLGDYYNTSGARNTLIAVNKPPVKGSYGAGQGRQIAVRLKSKTTPGTKTNNASAVVAAAAAMSGTVKKPVSGAMIPPPSSTTTTATAMAAVAAAAKSGAKKGQKRSLREL